MMNLLKTFWTNLEKWQKIVAIVTLQGAIILIIAATLGWVINSKKDHIEIIDESNQTASMPRSVKEAYEDSLWQNIKEYVKDVDRSVIRDVQIRDGSYEEMEVNGDGVIQAKFIVDIDSIQQTYRVTISWANDGSDVMETIIGCPTPDENKYPDSFCQGTYRNTDSLSLYLPHYVYPEGHDDVAPNYYISGDEDSKTIIIAVSDCNIERFKMEAWDYLNSIPIDFSEYTVEYETNSMDVECD